MNTHYVVHFNPDSTGNVIRYALNYNWYWSLWIHLVTPVFWLVSSKFYFTLFYLPLSFMSLKEVPQNDICLRSFTSSSVSFCHTISPRLKILPGWSSFRETTLRCLPSLSTTKVSLSVHPSYQGTHLLIDFVSTYRTRFLPRAKWSSLFYFPLRHQCPRFIHWSTSLSSNNFKRRPRIRKNPFYLSFR